MGGIEAGCRTGSPHHTHSTFNYPDIYVMLCPERQEYFSLDNYRIIVPIKREKRPGKQERAQKSHNSCFETSKNPETYRMMIRITSLSLGPPPLGGRMALRFKKKALLNNTNEALPLPPPPRRGGAPVTGGGTGGVEPLGGGGGGHHGGGPHRTQEGGHQQPHDGLAKTIPRVWGRGVGAGGVGERRREGMRVHAVIGGFKHR